jgi:hypothetical protein
MFSFRSDKTGFFVTLILLGMVGGTVLATILILAIGGWEDYQILLKWIWGTVWVLCIVTVLIRIVIFRWQMRKAEQARQQLFPSEQESASPGQEQGSGSMTDRPDRPSPGQA